MRKIPRRFSLMGHDIEVILVPDLVKKQGIYGCWMQTLNIIQLQEPGGNYSESFMLQTFWHEAVHAALDILGYEKLSMKEDFVDLMGQAIHQILKSKR